ncbi:hypothetical protein [Hydrogenophaga sp. RWCD_12]|uniref:hypothetical protein n=1 Tax=Hydrogenophaga sp. RWCD_12 TaxID=3391190 RepID=UPI0039851B37
MKPDTPYKPSPAAASAAQVRLAESRERLALWLAADRAGQGRPTLGALAAGVVWPLLKGLREHPSASLALGALAQGLLRPTPARTALREATPPDASEGLALLRRHPKAALALAAAVGAVWFWKRSRTRSPTR